MLEVIAVILAILIAIVLVALIYASTTRPDTFTYTRSARINASPDQIASLVSDFKRWGTWSPYEHRDPNLKRTYSGNPSGVGSVYAWEGNKNIGAGRMEILESTPRHIRIKLDFTAPFKANNMADFTFTPQGGVTEVVWAMTGKNVLMGKVMSLFMDMDKMIGKDFEAGLAAMKFAAENK
jgi:hypothetical protein